MEELFFYEGTFNSSYVLDLEKVTVRLHLSKNSHLKSHLYSHFLLVEDEMFFFLRMKNSPKNNTHFCFNENGNLKVRIIVVIISGNLDK